MRGPPTDDLTALLDDVAASPTAWEVFALGRAVERADPSAPSIGRSADPDDELVDWAHHASVDFPRTTIVALDRARPQPRVRSQHLGLTGSMGALPTHLTEAAIIERQSQGTTPFGDFLDLVSARALQAFYRAWASADVAAQVDRPADDLFATALGATSGSVHLRFVTGSGRGAHDADGFDDWRRLAYSGHLAGLRSASAVADMLAHALGRAVTVTETVGRWRRIDPDARTRIGRSGAHNALGAGASLGRQVFAVEWDVAFDVRATTMDELEQLLPGSDAHGILAEAITAILPQHLDWTTMIEIDEAAIRPARLGAARLGQTSWVAPAGRRRIRRDTKIVGGTAGTTRGRGGLV